jgi:hypothetical protein
MAWPTLFPTFWDPYPKTPCRCAAGASAINESWKRQKLAPSGSMCLEKVSCPHLVLFVCLGCLAKLSMSRAFCFLRVKNCPLFGKEPGLGWWNMTQKTFRGCADDELAGLQPTQEDPGTATNPAASPSEHEVTSMVAAGENKMATRLKSESYASTTHTMSRKTSASLSPSSNMSWYVRRTTNGTWLLGIPPFLEQLKTATIILGFNCGSYHTPQYGTTIQLLITVGCMSI